ncbi:MAG: tetratricopeptide repeat protein [Planctomycetes bacterium]|nr:tetratricopeptide repeat protein [Planctomycetota bacterium]
MTLTGPGSRPLAPRSTALAIAIPIFAAWVLPAAAEFMESPRDIPFARLEENVRRYIEVNPRDPQGPYILGRLHAIAYAQASEDLDDVYPGAEGSLPGMDVQSPTYMPEAERAWAEAVRKYFDGNEPGALSPEDRAKFDFLVANLDLDDYATREAAQKELLAMGIAAVPALREVLAGTGLSSEQRARVQTVLSTISKPLEGARHLREAIAWYAKALEIDPSHALSLLGTAWCLEEGGARDKSIDAYRKAHRAALEEELARAEWSHYSGGWHGSVALEAGERFLALSGTDGDATERDEVAKNVARLREKLKTAAEWITPILVPLEPVRTLSELLDPGRAVRFDLDGDGAPELRPWIRPSAGFLVWDPRGTGKVESARQMFGSITWYIPWNHGYEPLSLLDDNGDGRLAGAELDGLSLWRDQDSDGISGPGEVLPLAAWGVEGLSCRALLGPGGPWSPSGVFFPDGETRPTFDWIPALAQEEPIE